ncbi:mechanosensitive ion channel family protein [Halosimplex pelagicum]|uniref:Mechanosensitive ion channel n=1 Tax=Halosimplex pelagicum TaxID=869886 RepID=A0A7D5PF20_9EURY|nr:mechanosensitive ion channel domain-containing protein [Halosimplex pelagicum]QLH82700.1 mechanosensitive ion channel [Halosimplex pelagicum]
MVAPAASVPLQTTPGNGTATPGVGPEELVEFAPVVVRAAWFLVGFAVVVLVGFVVVEPLVSRAVRRRNRDNPTLQDAIARYVRVLVLAVAVVVGAGVAGLANVLTSSALVVAAATLAVGVAAQTVVGSLVGGLVLVFDPEFSVGDYIEWDDGEGTVEAITLRVTRVESPDGALVTVPNTVLTSQAITRPFGRGRYRVVERVDIDYADDPERATEILESVARGLDGAADRPEPVAFVDELGDGVVRLRAHFWLDDASQPAVFEIRSAFARRVRRRFDEAGITVSPASEHELRGRIAVDDDR